MARQVSFETRSQSLVISRLLMAHRKQTRPAGAHYPIDAVWKARVEARLAELGWNRSELARKIRATPSGITVMLRPKTTQSRLVPAVHRAFDWNPPPTAPAQDGIDEDMATWSQLFDDLDPSGRELVVALARKLARKDR